MNQINLSQANEEFVWNSILKILGEYSLGGDILVNVLMTSGISSLSFEESIFLLKKTIEWIGK